MQTSATSHVTELDRLPSIEREKYQKQALLRLWDVARRHPHTSWRFPTAPADEPTCEDILAMWRRISPATSTDQVEYLVKREEHEWGGAAEGKSLIVTSTGGSTSAPKLLINTYDEMLFDARFQGKSYRIAGIGAQDTVATFGGSGIYATDYGIYHSLAQIGCAIVPINDFRRAEENAEILRKLRVNVLLTLPSKLYPLISHLESDNGGLNHIRLIVTGGEAISPQLKERLSNQLGGKLSFGSTLRTTDHGAVGHQCQHCDEGEYHLHEELQYAELVPSVETGANELLISNLHCTSMPIVRLSAGDLAEWSDSQGKCRCGRTSRKIKLRGRAADLIKIGGEVVSGNLFSKLPERVGIHENLLHVLVRTTQDGKDLVEIVVDEPLRARYEHQLRSGLMADPTFSRLVNEQRVLGPVFAAPSENIGKAPGYGKLRVLRDMRQKQQ
jgi:phenylacetate-coenzyme A ligase PaaK-like adenylate-forming protein